MTTEIHSTTETATSTAAPEPIISGKNNVFLGLYFPRELKEKLATAAKNADCSMSKYAVRLFKQHLESLS